MASHGASGSDAFGGTAVPSSPAAPAGVAADVRALATLAVSASGPALAVAVSRSGASGDDEAAPAGAGLAATDGTAVGSSLVGPTVGDAVSAAVRTGVGGFADGGRLINVNVFTTSTNQD